MKDIKQELLDAIEPIVSCKVHNPNRSLKMTTVRTISPRAVDLIVLNTLFLQIQKSQAVHYLPSPDPRRGTIIDTEV